MFVRVKASHRVNLVEAVLLEHALHRTLDRNLVLTNNQALVKANWLMQVEPLMLSDVINFITLLRIGVEHSVK